MDGIDVTGLGDSARVFADGRRFNAVRVVPLGVGRPEVYLNTLELLCDEVVMAELAAPQEV